MKRYHVFKDGAVIGATATKEEAEQMIRQHQDREDHYLLRSEFSYIYGEEIFVPYKKN